jgi:hypothetical protein
MKVDIRRTPTTGQLASGIDGVLKEERSSVVAMASRASVEGTRDTSPVDMRRADDGRGEGIPNLFCGFRDYMK